MDRAGDVAGGVTGRIFVNNSDKAKKQEFGVSKEYWKSRMKAMAWSTFWSTQFELGPLSEASIDQAVAQTSVRGGWAESAFVRGTGGGAFEVQVSITNERAHETWLFDGEGNLKGTQ